MSDGGFFLMHRGWRDNDLFKGDFSRADAWIWLIENACWKPTRTRIKGTSIELDRGEMSFSVRFMADKWGWSKSRVDRFLDDLRDEGMIETRSKIGTGDVHKAGQGQSIITICNYAKYQDKQDGERDNSGTVSGTTAGQQRDKEEQGNKETSIGEEAKASPPRRAKPSPKFAMTADWVPAPLPSHLSDMVALWPPGRLARELEEFRAYWIERGEKRPGWDRSWHSRINDIHDKILRDARNGQPFRQSEQHLAPSGRPMGRTEAAARAAAERLRPTQPAASGSSERLSLPVPDALRANGDDGGRPYRVVDGRA